MDHVSMNDGLDGRETIAFGLVAGEIAVFVLALMAGYAVLRSGLPGAVTGSFAAVLVGGGAALAWLRVSGRPLLEWSVLLLRFVVRTRHAQLARLRQRVVACWPPSARPQAGALVLPLALRRVASDAGAPEANRALTVVRSEPESGDVVAIGEHRRSHVVAFFSLNGGTGRTALAVEVAAMLAMRGRAQAATRSPRLQVVLLDLTERNPRVGLRLGIAPPPATPAAAAGDASGRLLTHALGLRVWLPAAGDDIAAGHAPGLLLDAAEDAGAGIVVVDIDCDLGPRCVEVLRRCDQILVTLTPTAGGVVDAYRSTAVLRRMGLRERIGYVVNRWHPGIDISETMADLAGVVAAEVPDDRAVVDAENSHRIAGLDGTDSVVAAALTHLAVVIESAAGLQLAPLARCDEAVAAEHTRSNAHQTGRG